MAQAKFQETDLYPPIKLYLENQGYEVKSEIGAADIVAVRGEDDPVIVELKTNFSLTLFLQAIERQAITDAVYIAVPYRGGRAFYKAVKRNKILCRRLGIGLIIVRIEDGHVSAHIDPAPYKPRQSKIKKARLLAEFSKREGDPNLGGTARGRIMTAYRQDAIKCLDVLREHGPSKAADVAKLSGVTRARQIMYHNHYGWFMRPKTGIYALSAIGADEAQKSINEGS